MALKPTLIALVCVLILFGCAGRRQVRMVPIGPGWAKNSINAVIFRQHSVTTYGNLQYVAFYDPEGRVVLAKRALDSTEWETRITPHRGNVQDAHNTISIAVDGDGILHMSWDHHCHPLRYVRSVAPGSLELTGLVPMTGQNEERVTYPEFFNLDNGDLLFLYRLGSSGNGNTMLNRYDVRTRTWSPVQHPLIHGQGQRNAYTNQIAVDRRGVWHLSWTWRETPDVRTNHDICYARSSDQGRTWENSTGERYVLPITMENAELVFRVPQGSDLMNHCSMVADSRGRPILADYWRPEGASAPQYHLVWHDGLAWRRAQVGCRTLDFRLGGGGTRRVFISRPRLAVDRRDRVYMFFRDEERGHRVSVAFSDDPERRVWSFRDLTAESVGRWEPTFDSVLWRRDGVFHLFHQVVGQGQGETLESIPPQTVSILEWRP